MSQAPLPDSLKESLAGQIASVLPGEILWNEDAYGNPFGWLVLPAPDRLPEIMKILAGRKARLCTVSAYAEERDDPDKKRGIAYHFVLGRLLFTVSVRLYNPETSEELPVPSITPWFRNADWNEREFREMFDIKITGNPNPRRLFLDERLDAGIMNSLIPFSAMVNSAGSKDLWERLMAEKTGHVSHAGAEQPVAEPSFTQVARAAREQKD
ncbi:MAG: NADH-quinone oxidoreductase subunit C [Desulfovibrionaceae bacterium]|nr:NADH-quinone oxidoreductase subunit C [Desulfovibrionaceae bacterium]